MLSYYLIFISEAKILNIDSRERLQYLQYQYCIPLKEYLWYFTLSLYLTLTLNLHPNTHPHTHSYTHPQPHPLHPLTPPHPHPLTLTPSLTLTSYPHSHLHPYRPSCHQILVTSIYGALPLYSCQAGYHAHCTHTAQPPASILHHFPWSAVLHSFLQRLLVA